MNGIHVFDVEAGEMITFPSSLITKTVETLKTVIASKLNIQKEETVLLVSGGDVPVADDLLKKYDSNGTDSSPFFLVMKKTHELERRSMKYNSYAAIYKENLSKEFEAMIGDINSFLTTQITPTFEQQSLLANRMFTFATQKHFDLKKSEHFQHLQQQGYMALMAMMEDIFIKGVVLHMEKTTARYEECCRMTDCHQSMLEQIPHDLQELRDTPFLDYFLLKTNLSLTENEEKPELYHSKEYKNLLEVVCGNRKIEQLMVDYNNAMNGVNMLCGPKYPNMKKMFEKVCREMEKKDNREIKGIDTRLSKINSIIQESEENLNKISAKKMELEKAFSTSIYQSVNQKDIRRMYFLEFKSCIEKLQARSLVIADTNLEIRKNINSRLRWVIDVNLKIDEFNKEQNGMNAVFRGIVSDIMLYTAIHETTDVYFNYILEVLRRKKYNKKFSSWAPKLSNENREIYASEHAYRKYFVSHFENHILLTKLPRLGDELDDFATRLENPANERLPIIGPENLEPLYNLMPEDIKSRLKDIEKNPMVPETILKGYNFAPNNESCPCPENDGEMYISANSTPTVSPRKNTDLEEVLLPRRNLHMRDQVEQDSETDIDEIEKGYVEVSADGLHSPIQEKASQKEKSDRYHNRSSEYFSSDGPITPNEMHGGYPELDDLSESSRSSGIISESSNVLRVRPISDKVTDGSSEMKVCNVKQILALLHSLKTDIGKRVYVEDSEGSRVALNSNIKQYELAIEKMGHSFGKDFEVTLKEKLKLEEELEKLKNDFSDANKQVDSYEEEFKRQRIQEEMLKNSHDEAKRKCEEYEEEMNSLKYKQEMEIFDMKEKIEMIEKDHTKENEILGERIQLLENEAVKLKKEIYDSESELESKMNKQFEDKSQFVICTMEKLHLERAKTLQAVHKEELQDTENKLTEKLHEEHSEMLEKLKEEQNMALIAREESTKEKVKEDTKLLIKEMNEKHEKEIIKCRELWEAQKEEDVESKLAELESRLKSEYGVELERAKLGFKMEVESLRHRFKLISMDNKSPSESSLEKYEKGDFLDISSHDAAIEKLRALLTDEKDSALEDLRLELTELHSKRLEEENERISKEKQDSYNAVLKEITNDKLRVIENLKLQITFLSEENEKLLQKPVLSPSEVHLPSPVRKIARKSSFIEEPLPSCDLKEPESSPVEIRRLTLENAELKSLLERNKTEMKVSIFDCQPSDLVMIIYHETYDQYGIYLSGQPCLHFLHSDSYEALGIFRKKPERLQHCFGIVEKKEFCKAKKADNRFRVPKDTKFYRVRAKPYIGPSGLPRIISTEDNVMASSTTSTALGKSTISSSEDISEASNTTSPKHSFPSSVARLTSCASVEEIEEKQASSSKPSEKLPSIKDDHQSSQ